MLAFYRELDLGISGPEEWDAAHMQGNLVFLSARPHVYKGVSENISYDKFRKLQEKRGLYTNPSLLAGSMDSGTSFILYDNLEPLANKKYTNFTEYLCLYPEYKHVFVGDNGQGDVRTVEKVLASQKYSSCLERSYMHIIQPLANTHVKDPATKRMDHKDICYFSTYVDAAIDAYQHALIRPSGLRRVMAESKADFTLIPAAAWEQAQHRRSLPSETSAPLDHHPELGPGRSRLPSTALVKNVQPQPLTCCFDTIRDEALRQVNRSLIRGNRVLAESGSGLAPVSLLQFTCRFPPGTPVQTAYGKGVFVHLRPVDGVYEVLLPWDPCCRSPPVRAFLQGQSIFALPPPAALNKWLSPFGSSQPVVLRSVAANSPNSSQVTPLKPSARGRLHGCLGAYVWTPLGVGRLTEYREKDDMLTVSLLMGGHKGLRASLYIKRDRVVQMSNPLLHWPKTEPEALDKGNIVKKDVLELIPPKSSKKTPQFLSWAPSPTKQP